MVELFLGSKKWVSLNICAQFQSRIAYYFELIVTPNYYKNKTDILNNHLKTYTFKQIVKETI